MGGVGAAGAGGQVGPRATGLRIVDSVPAPANRGRGDAPLPFPSLPSAGLSSGSGSGPFRDGGIGARSSRGRADIFFFGGGGGCVRKPAFSRPSCSRPLRLVRLRPVPATVQARAFRQGPTGRRPWASPCYSAGEEGVAGAGRCPADTDAPPRPPPAPRAGTAALTEDADEATSAPSRAGWRRPWAGPTRNPPSSEPAVSTQKCAEGDQAGIRWRL